MLALVAELYSTEHEAKEGGLDDAALLTLRRERCMPVLEKIKAWLDAEGEVELPRRPFVPVFLDCSIITIVSEFDVLVRNPVSDFLDDLCVFLAKCRQQVPKQLLLLTLFKVHPVAQFHRLFQFVRHGVKSKMWRM
jgi:hypothetical protein